MKEGAARCMITHSAAWSIHGEARKSVRETKKPLVHQPHSSVHTEPENSSRKELCFGGKEGPFGDHHPALFCTTRTEEARGSYEDDRREERKEGSSLKAPTSNHRRKERKSSLDLFCSDGVLVCILNRKLIDLRIPEEYSLFSMSKQTQKHTLFVY